MRDFDGPAFPFVRVYRSGSFYEIGSGEDDLAGGMTLRDYFATHASEADIAAFTRSPGHKDRVVARYLYADAMLAQRVKP